MKSNGTRWVSCLTVGLLVLTLGLAACAAPSPQPTTTAPTAPTTKPTTSAPTAAPTATPTAKPITPAPAAAPAFQMPKVITVTGYDVGSRNYNQSVALGDALLKKYGVRLRVVPTDTDMSRAIPLRSKNVDFSLAAFGSFYVRRGEFEFATFDWGPQAYRLLWAPVDPGGNYPLVTTLDSGINTPRDLKGKRVYWVPGSPSSYLGPTLWLAFAGLTWDDVTAVECSSFAEGQRKMLEGKIDAMGIAGGSAITFELQSSPHGVKFVEFPPEDKAGWARLQKYGPFFPYPITMDAPGLKKEKPNWNLNVTYPVLLTYPWQDEQYVYEFVKMIHQSYDEYIKAGKDLMGGWNFKEAVRPSEYHPWHDGAVRYFKEQGWWTPEHEAAQRKLVEQEGKLKDAWNTALADAAEKKIASKAFRAFWEKYRDPILGKDANWYKIFGAREKLVH